MADPRTGLSEPVTIRVAHLLDGRHFGGAEQMVRRLAFASPRVGVEARVYCLAEGRLSEALQSENVPHRVFKGGGRFDFSPLAAMARAARADEIQILQAHTSRTHLMARILSRRLGIPNITSIQSPIALDENQKTGNHPLRAWVERAGRGWTDHLVAVSQEETDRLVREEGVAPSRISWIPNGLDCPEAPDWPQARQRLVRVLREGYGVSMPEEAFVAAMIAQMRPRKGPEVLLRAFGRWLRQGGRGYLLMIGDDEFVERGGYLQDLRRLACEEGIADFAIFTGFLPQPWNLVAGANLLTLPSLFGEGLPLVLIEAMGRALPLAVSDTPGNRELVPAGKTGWLHPPGDELALAGTLMQAADDPEGARQRGRAGRDLFLERYTLDSVLRKYRALYQKLLADKVSD